ncbi:MAG: FemAB family XrtA/PEP-CTERM system-associated protein [Aureliella sp.]
MPVVQLSANDPWPALPKSCLYPALAGHDRNWVSAISAGLKHKSLVLVHRSSSGEVDGILPLAQVESWLFGKFLVSLPYINTGGVWATNETAATALVSAACDLADELDVRYLELRHERPVEHERLTVSRSDKVHMRLDLPATEQELDKSFKSKLRSQLKKTQEHGLQVAWGRHDLLSRFYDVFAVNMRDLGTPVFSKRLFAQVLTAFPDSAEFCVVSKGRQTVAAGLLVHYPGERTEVPSASSLRSFNSTGANMWMYRQMLARAIDRGSPMFDFGRSSEGSGTYKFKAQWGALPQPAAWQYYVRKGQAEDLRPSSQRNQKLIKIWQKLPVSVSRWLGPSIVRGIP